MKALLLHAMIGVLHAQQPHAHHHAHGAKTELPATAPSTDSVFQSRSTWTDERGNSRRLADLSGRVIVIAMIYTGCPTVCPVTVEDVRAIESRLSASARKRTRFLLVSFDPTRDTPARLADYARARHLDSPSWTLWTGNGDASRDLAAVLGMRFQELPGGEFAHSNVVAVLGPDGAVRHRQVGLGSDPGPAVGAVEELVRGR